CVRRLMPERPPLAPTDMQLEARDGARIARGLLAPLSDGEPVIARGLLLGLPSGFTFEYASDDVRLLVVRRGEFVTRSDWESRGGRPLTPLGAILPRLEGPPPPPAVAIVPNGRGRGAGQAEPEAEAPLVARLETTWTRGAEAGLEFDLVDADGIVLANVKETPSVTIAAGASGFTERFEIASRRGPQSVRFVAYQSPRG